jgi:hypothetical protein
MRRNLPKILLCITLIALTAQPCAKAQNLVQGGDMTDESAWNITYFGTDQPMYEFNYTGDSLKYGRGGCLYLNQGEASGQLLLWQRLTLIAGKTYRATGAIREMTYYPGGSGGGAWYQMYISPEEVDPGASDWNPGPAIRFFDLNGWQEFFPDEFDGLFEVELINGQVPSAPYYTPEGSPGEEVEVTFGIKFGQYWPDYSGTGFELLVDEIGLYPVESAVNAGGDMSDESLWNVTYFNAEQPLYEFNYTGDSLKYGRDGNLYMTQGEASGQLLFWQRLTLTAGETYWVTGAIREMAYYPGGAGGGAWYQLYIHPDEVDPGASDWNPGPAIRFYDLNGWQEFFPDEFDGLFEVELINGQMPSAPFYTPEGSPGEDVEVTFGIKFGQYWPAYTGTGFEILVDEVYIFPMTEGGTGVSEKQGPMLPGEYALHPNYPNPFNPGTVIPYDIPEKGSLSMAVFDRTGRRVRTLLDQHVEPGRYTVEWEGRNEQGSAVPSGVYFVKMRINGRSESRKLTLIK